MNIDLVEVHAELAGIFADIVMAALTDDRIANNPGIARGIERMLQLEHDVTDAIQARIDKGEFDQEEFPLNIRPLNLSPETVVNLEKFLPTRRAGA